MPDSRRLRAVKALTDALKTITVANGYEHDIGEHVYRGRLVLTEEDGLPALAVNEPPQMPDLFEAPTGTTSAKTTVRLLVQGFVKDSRPNPTDPAYNLLADVQKCLVQQRAQDDGFNILGFPWVTDLHLGQAVVRPPDAVVSDNSFFWLQVTLVFAEDQQNPFA